MAFAIEPLPAHPNFEYQQKLAKQLLRDVWAGAPQAIGRVRQFLAEPFDPDALKLHQAQAVIARGYGFETWAAMKHKIESLTQTPLEQFDAAVREGDAARAAQLLERHAAVRARINELRFDFDSPAIHQAKHNVTLVDVLLAHGADINARSGFWAGGFGILEHDIDPKDAAPLIERGARVTPWAAAGLGLIEELRSHLQERPQCVHERGGDGKTVLHCAATVQIAELLADSGADLEARDTDHGATALQYLIGNEPIARALIGRGARADIFAAARLGDMALVDACLREDPQCAQVRVNVPPYTAPGGHIYAWTLGFDLTPADVARKFGHPEILDTLLASQTSQFRLVDALWCGDRERLEREIAVRPDAVGALDPHIHVLLPMAAWWYRPESVRLMLEVGFDPHARGYHKATALDRASFHGYADIVEMLLAADPNPPLRLENEFGGIPLNACVHGSLHGWDTGYPQDHVRTLRLLLQAGSAVSPAWLPTGNDELDAVLRSWLKELKG